MRTKKRKTGLRRCTLSTPTVNALAISLQKKISAKNRTKKAINLLQIADLTNPNKKAMEAAEKKLVEMGVVDNDGCYIINKANRAIQKWISKNF
jgi:hypothetical protein